MKRRLYLTALGALLAVAAHATGIYVNVSGTWHEVTDPQVKVSGSWQAVKEGWVKVSGTWEQFYQRASFSAGTAGTYTDNDPFASGAAEVQLQLNTNGTATIASTSPGTGQLLAWNWIDPTDLASGSYSARLNTTSGTPSSGSANTDLTLDAARLFKVSSSGPSKSWSFTLQIKEGSTVLDSANYTLTADAQ